MGDNQTKSPFDKPISVLKSSNPKTIAGKTGTTWEPGEPGDGHLVVPVLHREVSVSYPDISLRADPELDSFPLKLLTLIYLSSSDGAQPSGQWVAFRDLPGGRFYEPVVSRSVEQPLAVTYGDDLAALEKASLHLGGRAGEFGDASFIFTLLPLVLICFIVWRPDEEFPARATVLFDSNSSHHLTAFDLRMGAQEITSRLIRLKEVERR